MTPAAGLIVASAFAVSAAAAGSCGACQPKIHEPVAQLAYPAAKSAAVYFRIENTCDRQILLNRAASPSVRRAEFHSSVETSDGVVSMRPVTAGIAVRPGESLALEPSGLHVMLTGLDSAKDEGGAVMLTLSIGQTEEITFAAPIAIGQ